MLDHVRYGDVPLEVQAELDRKALTVREIMQLEVGGVIRMTRSAGENVDIVVGGSLVAYGEIVIIEEALGVRITDFNGEGF